MLLISLIDYYLVVPCYPLVDCWNWKLELENRMKFRVQCWKFVYLLLNPSLIYIHWFLLKVIAYFWVPKLINFVETSKSHKPLTFVDAVRGTNTFQTVFKDLPPEELCSAAGTNTKFVCKKSCDGGTIESAAGNCKPGLKCCKDAIDYTKIWFGPYH